MVHTVLCTTWIEKKEKQLWNHYCSAVIWLWLFSNESQMLHRKQKSRNTNCAHWCFWCPQWGFVSKAHWWCLTKSTNFLLVFKVFLHLLSKPFVSHVGLSFCWFCFSLLSCLLLVVVWQIKLLCSGFCFCCFGFPWFGYVLCVVFLSDWFWFGFLFWRV